MKMMKDVKRIVLKVGSALLVGEDNYLRKAWIEALAQDIADLKRQNKEVIVVTSGAVALGRHPLGYGNRPLKLEEKQAAAACGQIALTACWAEVFQKSSDGLSPAQILLTANDSINRRRYLNARNTLDALLENEHVVPIINENDTVATAELRFGDNDRLAARVAQMVGADLLVVFSDVDGLYSANPIINNDAEFIADVPSITDDIEAMAGEASSSISSGGMITKIAAAKIATAAGCNMVLARGTYDHPLKELMDGGKHTLFHAQGNPVSARKNWIAGSVHITGDIVVDDGAAKALASGKSLLPAGVKSIDGQFERGDTVVIKTILGNEIGKGLIAYDSSDAKRIMGKQSKDIEEILGFKGRDVLIHRDDMVL